MNTLLDEALAGLGLEPGQSYTTTVGDCEYEIHVRDKAAAEKPSMLEKLEDEEPSEYADMVMLNIIPVYPPSPTAFTVEAIPGKWPAPDPVIIDEWDRTEE